MAPKFSEIATQNRYGHIDYTVSSSIFWQPYPQVNPGAGPSHPAPAASASSLPPVTVAFEESTTSQAPEASQAGSEPVGDEDAAGYDAVFGQEDTWGFLQRLRVAQDLYSEECNRSHHFQEQLNCRCFNLGGRGNTNE